MTLIYSNKIVDDTDNVTVDLGEEEMVLAYGSLLGGIVTNLFSYSELGKTR